VAVGILMAFGLLGVAQVALGLYRLISSFPGLTGIRSTRVRAAASLLSGTDVRSDGTPSRRSLGDGMAGVVQIFIGVVMLLLVTGGLF
jgi:hypothetical protein